VNKHYVSSMIVSVFCRYKLLQTVTPEKSIPRQGWLISKPVGRGFILLMGQSGFTTKEESC